MVIALIVSPERLPLSYEVFSGNRLDVTTLKKILEAVEKKYGQAQRVWVFDRGIVSEENLGLLRERGSHYLVGTPRRQLKAYEKQMLEGGWEKASSEVEVKLVAEQDEVYVVCRSPARRAKEKAMRVGCVCRASLSLKRPERVVAPARLAHLPTQPPPRVHQSQVPASAVH